MALSGLMLLSAIAFITRRLFEARRDSAIDVERTLEIQNLRDQALCDPLTELPNRRRFLAALSEATSGPRQDRHQHALFVLDLDNFKRINDERGHATGDHVLKIVVQRFQTASRPCDLLARLGGDEFAVLAYDCNREGAEAIGARFLGSLAKPVWVEGRAYDVGVSIGIALIPHDGVTNEELLCNADLAMYRAKELDHSAMVFFHSTTAIQVNLESARRA